MLSADSKNIYLKYVMTGTLEWSTTSLHFPFYRSNNALKRQTQKLFLKKCLNHFACLKKKTTLPGQFEHFVFPSHGFVRAWLVPKLPCLHSCMLPWFHFHSVHGACFFCFILSSLLNPVLIAIVYRKSHLPHITWRRNFTLTGARLNIPKLQSMFSHVFYWCSFCLGWSFTHQEAYGRVFYSPSEFLSRNMKTHPQKKKKWNKTAYWYFTIKFHHVKFSLLNWQPVLPEVSVWCVPTAKGFFAVFGYDPFTSLLFSLAL